MQLNETYTNGIRTDTFDGDEYLVAPVRAVQAQTLDGGYVPAAQVEKSVSAWNGTPVTLFHPRTAEGELTSANSPDIAEKTWLGYLFNAEYDADAQALDGEVWINIDRAEEVGGAAEQALETLRNEEPLSVSTAYFGDRLEPGEYDGDHREQVIGNLRPDHLAVLPGNKEGKCSIEDGCMAGAPAPAANADGRVWLATNAPATAGDGDATDGAETADDPGNAGEVSGNVLSEARTPEYSGTESASWSDVTKSFSAVTSALDIDADSVADLSASERSDIAQLTLLGDPDADTFDGLYVFPVVNHTTGNLNEGALDAVLSGRGSQADISESALESARSVAERLLTEEFDRDLDTNSDAAGFGSRAAEAFAQQLQRLGFRTDDTMDREDMISVLTNEHGFNEESLEGMGDSCLERTYQSFATNDDGSGAADDGDETDTTSADGDADDGTTPEDDTPGTDDDTITMTEDELDAEIEARVDDRIDSIVDDRVEEALAANQREQQRQALVDEIVANSDDYDADALADTPVDVLETIRDDVQTADAGATFAAQRGGSAQPATNEADDFPALSVSEAGGDD